MRIVATLFYFSLSCSMFGQNILYVNNNNGAAPEHFTSLAVAVDSAVNEDIIYLQPSPTSYGNVTIDKKVTIYGSGYSISSNPSIDIPTILHNCIVSNLVFNQGSEGSTISGLRLNDLTSNSASSLKIKRSFVLGKLILIDSDSTIIEGCFFNSNCEGLGGSTDDYHLVIKSGSNDILVLNNIFNGYSNNQADATSICGFMDNLHVSAGCSAIIKNNIFRDRVNITNSFAFNNIFIHGSGANELDATTSTVQSNVFSTNETAFSDDNIINYGVDSIFVGYPSNDGFSFDSKFQLHTNSPAIGFANDGGDCGVFDGTNKYRLSGLPNTPIIFKYNIPNQVPSNGQLNIIIKAKSD